MPRPNLGPRLVTKQPRGYPKPFYFIRWYEGGRKLERATGTADRGQAEKALGEFAAGRSLPAGGPRHPSEIGIADVLALYAEKHGPSLAEPARIGYAVSALLDYWADNKVSAVTGETCRAYRRHRLAMKRSDGTIRRELSVLGASVEFAHKEGALLNPPAVTLPPKPPSRDRWLTRQESAALLRAAKSEPKARWHLPLFILVGLYMPARMRSILALRWTQNTTGGWVDLKRGIIDFNPAGRRQTSKRRPVAPIPGRLLCALRRAHRRATTDHVFELDGQPIKSVKRSFARSARQAKLARVTPHVLRHTGVTWLMQKGVAAWEVAGFAGMSVEMIQRHYGHHAPDYLKAAATAHDRRA